MSQSSSIASPLDIHKVSEYVKRHGSNVHGDLLRFYSENAETSRGLVETLFSIYILYTTNFKASSRPVSVALDNAEASPRNYKMLDIAGMKGSLVGYELLKYHSTSAMNALRNVSLFFRFIMKDSVEDSRLSYFISVYGDTREYHKLPEFEVMPINRSKSATVKETTVYKKWVKNMCFNDIVVSKENQIPASISVVVHDVLLWIHANYQSLLGTAIINVKRVDGTNREKFQLVFTNLLGIISFEYFNSFCVGLGLVGMSVQLEKRKLVLDFKLNVKQRLFGDIDDEQLTNEGLSARKKIKKKTKK
jgi:hypothetical protein